MSTAAAIGCTRTIPTTTAREKKPLTPMDLKRASMSSPEVTHDPQSHNLGRKARSERRVHPPGARRCAYGDSAPRSIDRGVVRGLEFLGDSYFPAKENVDEVSFFG